MKIKQFSLLLYAYVRGDVDTYNPDFQSNFNTVEKDYHFYANPSWSGVAWRAASLAFWVPIVGMICAEDYLENWYKNKNNGP
jgi:hypothetical protein